MIKTIIMGTWITIVTFILAISQSPAKPGQEEMITKTGEEIFKNNCARCHGLDGTKGRWGAKNLKTSKLTDIELTQIITQGKRIMPSWKNTLTQEEIKSVKEYVKKLRQ